MRTRAILAILLTLFAVNMLTLAFNIQPVSAHSGEVFSAWAPVAPVIDGWKEWEGVWDHADHADVLIFDDFWVMNDAENLYICVSIYDDTVSSDDEVWVYFDNDNDGRLESGDDIYGWSSMAFVDGFYLFGGSWRDIAVGGTSDGMAGAQTFWFSGLPSGIYEIAHPLNSEDDAHDFSLGPGDTVGFALQWVINGGHTFWWPSSDPAEWHDIRIASPLDPNVDIEIDKPYPWRWYDYGETVYVDITLINPSPNPKDVIFIGSARDGFSGPWTTVVETSYTIPANTVQTFELTRPCDEDFHFTRTWLVAILEPSTMDVINTDSVMWSYMQG